MTTRVAFRILATWATLLSLGIIGWIIFSNGAALP